MCVPSVAVTLAGLWGQREGCGRTPRGLSPLLRTCSFTRAQQGQSQPGPAEPGPRFNSGSGAGIGVVCVTLRDPEDLCMLCLQIQ